MKWLYYTVLLLACCRMAGCGSDKDSVSVLPSDPPAPEEPEYVDPTAGFREVGPWGSMEDMIPDENTRTPNFLNVTTIIFACAIRAAIP